MPTPDRRRTIARLGGKARAARLTPAERSASARRAVQARWARHKAAMLTTWILGAASTTGGLAIGFTLYYDGYTGELYAAD